jgi:hypothetical protein
MGKDARCEVEDVKSMCRREKIYQVLDPITAAQLVMLCKLMLDSLLALLI